MPDILDQLFDPHSNEALHLGIAAELETAPYPVRISDDLWIRNLMEYLIHTRGEKCATQALNISKKSMSVQTDDFFGQLQVTNLSPTLEEVVHDESEVKTSGERFYFFEKGQALATITLDLRKLLILAAGSEYVTIVVHDDAAEIIPYRGNDEYPRRYGILTDEKEQRRIARPDNVTIT